MGTFKDFMVELAPPWLRSYRGEAWARANGDMKDSLVDRAKQAVKARFALLAPRDALALLGSERQLPAAPGEATASYANRVKNAWETWPWAGTPFGLLNALRDSGYPGTQLIIAKGKKYSLNATQELVVTDLGIGIPPSYWSAFFVYFPNASFPAGWSGTPPAQSSDEGKFLIALIQKWKSAHARFDSVVFDMGGPIWGLPTWGSFNWGGTAPVVWTIP